MAELGRSPRRPDRHAACPQCGPHRRDPANRRRKVLGIWRHPDGSETTWCVRCGYSDRRNEPPAARTAPSGKPSDRQAQARKAGWLWSLSVAAPGTPVDTYLREGRAIGGPPPPTLRYLPASGGHRHAMIAAFGLCAEPAPGQLAPPETVCAVHVTRLGEDGRQRLEKRMIGPVSGQPIVLAPPNDALGLIITEGIEDALSLHTVTGLGAWAAGSAAHLAKLTEAVPAYIDCATVIADADPAGDQGAAKLACGLKARGLRVEVLSPARHD